MDFKELLALLISPPEEGNSETIYDDLGAAYDNDVSTRDATISGHAATIAERDSAAEASAAAYAALEAENVALKAMNFDLLMGAQSEPVNEPDAESPAEPDENIDIADLF